MPPSIEARDFSPDPPNRQETLDSYRSCLSCKHFQFLDPLFFGEVGYCSAKKEYLTPMKHCCRYEPRNQ